MKKALFVLLFALIATSSIAMPAKADAAVSVTPVLKPTVANFWFSDFSWVTNVAYEFTYTHAGIQEGVTGEFAPRWIPLVFKSVTLGTCSTGGTCVYHTNISNAKLKVATSYRVLGIKWSDTKTYNVR